MGFSIRARKQQPDEEQNGEPSEEQADMIDQTITAPPIDVQDIPPVDYQEPPQPQTRSVRYQVLVCEKCSQKLRVTTTRGNVRFLKCTNKECGETFKISGEDRVTLAQA